MHPIGSHITKCWKNAPYVTSASEGAGVPVLLKAVQAVAKLASVCVPAALRVIQDSEKDSGLEHVPGMDGGICRVAHSMDLSINLANSSHYDSNDASQGLTIWTEDNPHTTKCGYFVRDGYSLSSPSSSIKRIRAQCSDMYLPQSSLRHKCC